MEEKVKLLIFLVFLFIASAFSSFYLYSIIYPPQDTSTSTFSSVVLGEADYGTVIREGPYGNADSPHRIVYIVGVHPLEYQVHQALLEAVTSQNESLKNCYYIYRVNVTQDAEDYEKGRSHGQLLANNYVVPDIENMSIDLVIDVHSNEGNYQKTRFLFIPEYSEKSEMIALAIKNQTNWLTIYSPPNPTSPAYVTIPLIEAGIPSLIYETYTYESVNQTRTQTQELVSIVDNLSLWS
ncbi:hypothetical protein [Methanobacterium ferruginis]|uniref:hypothetical protein n=1 Tax=Methanobacterium ferruginis TaxID=710191 RepID=UPI002573D600|nr:hypothetical protein [Methanobacterium ferruginis]BDZ68282.1 hypothetical protein GCM10025860_17300 [Methanobacterium ferruginis]